jgi:hypothetical protein
MSDLRALIRAEVDAHRPISQPPLDQLVTRRTRRRTTAGITSACAVVAAVAIGASLVRGDSGGARLVAGGHNSASSSVKPATTEEPKDPTYTPPPPDGSSTDHFRTQIFGPNAFSDPFGPAQSTSALSTYFAGHDLWIVASVHDGVAGLYVSTDVGRGTGHSSSRWYDRTTSRSLVIVAYADGRVQLRDELGGAATFNLTSHEYE